MSLYSDLNEVLTPYAQRIKALEAADEQMKADLGTLDKEPITAEWEKGNFNSRGVKTSSENYIRTDFIQLPTKAKVQFGGVVKGENEQYNRAAFAYCYGSDKATYLGRVDMIGDLYVTPESGTCYVRFTYGFSSASGLTIDDVSEMANQWECCFVSELRKNIDGVFLKNAFVTPQMYGAKADGVTDDTAAFQAALNSGGNVYVPTNNHEIYRITSTLTVPNTCKCIFGTGQWRTAATYGGYITFDLSGKNMTVNQMRIYPMFDLDSAGSVMIQGLKFTCEKVTFGSSTKRVGYFVSAMNTSKVDYDFRLENVQVGGFYRGIRLTGRGCEVCNSQFNSINYLATFLWDHDTNSNHPAGTGQRGIAFKNNRLHSISSGIIRVISGNVYGFTFTNNTIDNGKGYLISNESVTDVAKNWLISGNVIQGIETKHPVMRFKGGIENAVISNNIFSAEIGYWYGRTESPPAWLMVDGDAIGCVISSNTFKNASGSAFVFNGLVSGTGVCNNVFDGMCRNNISDETEYDDEGQEIDYDDEDERPEEVESRLADIWFESDIIKTVVVGNVSYRGGSTAVIDTATGIDTSGLITDCNA